MQGKRETSEPAIDIFVLALQPLLSLPLSNELTSRKNGSGKRKGRGVSDSVGWPSQENGVWIYGAFAGFFSRENHITWQVMETFSDDPNVALLQLGYKYTKY